VTFRFIHEHRHLWPVRLLCQTLEVSTAGYYAWQGRPASARAQRRDTLLGEIRAVHAAVKARYGSPRMHAALVARGHGCCVNTVAQLMRQAGIAAKTGEGWLYLAVVEDLYARRVVGWSMAENLESRLVVDALALAVERRLPGEGLLAHSDRGSQYASEHYQRLLARHGITCSMSRRADCWDNAPMESFFASLKKELIHGSDFATRAAARAAVVEYIEVFYNNQRLHSSLGYVSPAEYER